jgi:putative MATE family efflux protein
MAGGSAVARARTSLLEDSIPRVLTGLTLPMILGLASTSLFNVVDAYFVGRLGGGELAALGFTFPITLVLTNMAGGLSVAATSVVSRAAGQGEQGRAARTASHALWSAAALGLVLAGVGLLTLGPFMGLLGVSPELQPLVRGYMTVWYGGLPLLLVPMVGSSIIRAMGDARTPAVVLVVSVVINAALDPLLIFGFGPLSGLGLAGAAWAAAVSRAVMLGAFLFTLFSREGMVERSLPRASELRESLGPLLSIALPATASRLVFPVSMMMLTRLIARHGPEGVAALGVGNRVESLVMMIIGALSTALIPFVGQNWGAGNKERAWRGMRVAVLFTLAWGAACWGVLLFAAPWVASWFTPDAAVAAATTSYLRILSLSFGFQGVCMLVSVAFNAVNRPLVSTTLTLVRMFGLYLPLAYAGAWLWGRDGVFIAGSAATIVGGVAALLWCERFFSREARSGQA